MTTRVKLPKRVMPGPGTRDQVIQFLHADLVERGGPFLVRIENSLAGMLDSLNANNLVGTTFSAGSLLAHSLSALTSDILSHEGKAWADLQRYFSYMKWSIDLQAHRYDQEEFDYAEGTWDDDGLTFFYMLARASFDADWVKPSARMLYNTMINDGYMPLWDRSSPFEDVLFRLVVMDLKNEWIDPLEDHWGGGDLGDFKRLLTSVGSPDWENALIEYCDFRLARAEGYSSLQAKKPSPANREATHEFEGCFFALFPLELLVLKAVYEKATQRPLSLDADHPLLHLPTMTIPKTFTLIEDDITRSMQALGAREFGNSWKPGTAPEIKQPSE